MSRAERKEVFLSQAITLFDALEEWYEAHPQASFGEIEAEARKRRRELMGETLAVLINGRDTGKKKEGPACRRCGQSMRFKGHRPWTIYGLEGDTKLERAYYRCEICEKETLFPPG
jgi:hypothetical protein